MASKKKADAVPPISDAPIQEPTPTENQGPRPYTPDEVWADVEEVSERLGIDKKMALDLLQLTLQVNESQLVVRLAYKPEEITALAKQIIPLVMDYKAKATQEG